MNPLQRQRQLRNTQPEERLNPYQHLYGLRENPFPSLALFTPSVDDPRRNGTIYDERFRYNEEREFFQMFVQPPTGDAPRQLGFVRLDPQAGGRGNGKSAFLHHVMERINTQQWEDWPGDPQSLDLFALAVHVLPEPREQKRFWQFVFLIFKTLAERGLFQKIDEQLRAAILINLLSEEQASEVAALPVEQVEAILQSHERFYQLLDQYHLTAQAYLDEAERQLRLIAPTSLNHEFAGWFRAADGSLTALWENWQRNGIVGNAIRWRKQGADWLLNGLVPVLIAAGYQRLFILLDEFEKIYIYQTTRERDEFLDALRQYFYERDSAAVQRQYISTILTIHPSIYRYLRDNWVRVGLENLAPLDRQMMSHQSVELGASTREKLTHLLITYLDQFRMEGQDEHTGTLYPFASDALEPALDAARYYPRGTLWYAYTLLHQAASSEIPAPIDRDYVQAFISSTPRPPAAEDENIFTLPLSDSPLQG